MEVGIEGEKGGIDLRAKEAEGVIGVVAGKQAEEMKGVNPDQGLNLG